MDLEPVTPEELVAQLRHRWITAHPETITTPPTASAIARSSWDEFSRLVLVDSATNHEVVGHPLELGHTVESDALLYLPPHLTTLGVPMTASTTPATFPAVIFDATVGRAEPEWASRARTGMAPLTGTRQRQPFEDVTRFLNSWTAATQSPTVVEIFAEADITPTQIAEVLEIPIPIALTLRRGQRTPTAQEAARLTNALPLPEGALARASASVPASLRTALSGAKYRSVIELFKGRLGSFTDAFNNLAAGALSAARSDASEADWEDRIDRYIEGSQL